MDGIIDYARKSSRDADFHTKLMEMIMKAGKKLVGTLDKVLTDQLNPSQHGIAYVELLAYKLSTSTPPNEVKNVNEFIEQVRHCFIQLPIHELQTCSKSLIIVSRQFTKYLLTTERTIRGVGPLKMLIEKMTIVAPSVLTPIHVDLLLLVLKSHAYDLIGDATFLTSTTSALTVSPTIWPIDMLDILQYWYYLGNHHSSRKEFVKSQEAYNMVLTIPCQGAVSAIQTEAYKKFVLVSLLASGEVPPFNPRLTNALVIRTIESLCAPYVELAKHYRKSSISAITHQIEQYTPIYVTDKNFGLIKQIVASLTKQQICKLTQTYITFSLGEIASQLGNQGAQGAGQAERYVYNMICSNEIYAKLNSADSMVRFLDDPEEYDTTPFIDSMDQRIQEVAILSKKLGEIERDLQLTPAYIMRSGIIGGRGGGGMGGDSDIALAKVLSLSAGHHGGSGGGSYEDDDMKMAIEASLNQQ